MREGQMSSSHISCAAYSKYGHIRRFQVDISFGRTPDNPLYQRKDFLPNIIFHSAMPLANADQETKFSFVTGAMW